MHEQRVELADEFNHDVRWADIREQELAKHSARLNPKAEYFRVTVSAIGSHLLHDFDA